MPRLPKPVFIFTSIIISLFISSFLYSHYFNASPEFNAVALKNDSQSLITAITSFHIEFPRINLISELASPTPEPNQEPIPTIEYETIPTEVPSSPPSSIPTNGISIIPTYSYRPTKIPTKLPIQPTKTPKPTEKPKPTPTPLAPPEYIRPGTSLEDIYKIAGEKRCVPAALLKAFVAQEGPGALSYSDQSALFYNAYDWWHRAKEVKEVCGGYAYHTETGLIPQDSLFAGEKCKEGFNPSTTGYDSGSMGATQILQSYWDKTYKDKVKQKLKVGQADRRVLLDSLVGFGLIVVDNTKYSGSCNNWEFKYVIKAACANAGGSCEPYNYCYTICNNYNKYSGQNNNCNNVKDLFVPGSYCQFK